MKKYILKGLTETSKMFRSLEDIEILESMIGIELYDHSHSLGRPIFLTLSGGRIHSDYIIVEEVIEGMSPEVKELALKDKIIMKKYILKGISEEGFKTISEATVDYLEGKIGCEVHRYNGTCRADNYGLFVVYGDARRPIHGDFIIIEEVIEGMNPEKMERPTFNQFEPEEINCAEDMRDWYATYTVALERYIDYLERSPVIKQHEDR